MSTRTRMISRAVTVIAALWAAGCSAPQEGEQWQPVDNQTVPAAIHSIGESPASAPALVKELWSHPCRQRIVSRVWLCVASNPAEMHKVRCQIPDPSYVAVGGGAWVLPGEQFPGAFIIDQHIFNVNTKDAWVASSKSHVLSHPHILGVYVIGLKIPEVSRDELASNLRVHNAVAGTTNHPEAWVIVPEDRIVVSGGVFSEWAQGQSPGQLLVGSFGSSAGRSWGAKTKDHILADPKSSIVLAYTLPRSIGGINLKGTSASDSVDRPSGLAEVPVKVVGALTGIAGWAHFHGEGRMLTRMAPLSHDLSDRWIVVSSKDHRSADGGVTFANALGIAEDIGPVRCP
jgi:hypothetical protein